MKNLLAGNIAKLVESDSHLQIGIGNLFDAVGTQLKSQGRKGIKIFTEMFGDSMMDMIKNGQAESAVTSFAFGSEGLYQWLNNNEKVVFEPTLDVNNPATISALPQFDAVNTALQVNFIGDANAEVGPGGRRISSPGGQVDFMSGAVHSKGGKAILAIRSTAKEGALSTIVANLYEGNVTTPHEMVTHVVTEYGIAELAGKTVRERTIAILSIAHPKFRKELIKQAIEKQLLKPEDESKIPLE